MSVFWGVVVRLLVVSLLALSLPTRASMMSTQETGNHSGSSTE